MRPLPLSLVALALTTVPLSAQTASHTVLLNMALDNVPKARCDGGKACAPVSDAERMTLITDVQAKTIVSAATISTLAEHCGLDWQKRNFVPLMMYHREKLKMTERQMAVVGLLHGIAMNIVGDVVRKTPCAAEMKTNVEAKLPVK